MDPVPLLLDFRERLVLWVRGSASLQDGWRLVQPVSHIPSEVPPVAAAVRAVEARRAALAHEAAEASGRSDRGPEPILPVALAVGLVGVSAHGHMHGEAVVGRPAVSSHE